MNISQQIKNYRSKSNISQEELAEILFVSRQTISNWETKKTYPDLRSILMMSEYFNISLDELVKGDLIIMKHKESTQLLSIWTLIGFVSLLPVLIGIKIIISKGTNLVYLTPVVLFSILSILGLYKVEKIKSDGNIQTYKEIKTYMNNYSLSEMEEKEETKNPNKSKIVKFIIGGAVGIVIAILIDFILI